MRYRVTLTKSFLWVGAVNFLFTRKNLTENNTRNGMYERESIGQ